MSIRSRIQEAIRPRRSLYAGVAVSSVVFALTVSVQATPQDRSLANVSKGVVELFTSQGCAKCPPADRLIGDLAAKPGTIALSFPVNYWDYIGWKDTLASPAFAARQHAYAATRGDGLIFTPQAIVDGIGVRPGADRHAILGDLDSIPTNKGAMTVPMSVSEQNGHLHIAVGSGAADQYPAQPVGVYVLRVAHTKTVEIDRGENKGRDITYTNVVRAMNQVGTWSGKDVSFDILELNGDGEGYVVLLQAGTPGALGVILAAGKTANL